MSPVRSLSSCWRNGCIHIQGTRLHCVEENCRITTHYLPASSLFQACPLHSFLLSTCTLPPVTFFFCPPNHFLTSFLVLQQPCSANIDTNTSTPTHPFQAAFSCCLPHNPWLYHPLPEILHLSFSHSIFFYHGDRGRNLSKMVVK